MQNGISLKRLYEHRMEQPQNQVLDVKVFYQEKQKLLRI